MDVGTGVGQAIAGTITAMLVALFSLLVRAMLKVGDRDVTRYEGEVKRLRNDLAAEKRESAMWREMYLNSQGRDAPDLTTPGGDAR